MAAAPDLVVCESTLVSPELALVDAELAAELRLTLAPIEATSLPPEARRDEPRTASDVVEAAAVEDLEDVFDWIEDDAVVERAPVDDTQEEFSGDPEGFSDDDYILEVIEQATIEQDAAPRSRYPALPTPTQEAIDHMDAALRGIRERLIQTSPVSGRRLARFRRRSSLAT